MVETLLIELSGYTADSAKNSSDQHRASSKRNALNGSPNAPHPEEYGLFYSGVRSVSLSKKSEVRENKVK